MKKILISRKREIRKEEIQSSNRKFQGVSIPNTSGLQCQKIQKKQPKQTVSHNQEKAEISECKCCECWENYVQKSKEDYSMECVRCTNWLHELSSAFKEKFFACSRK
jgi:hypothetical protein